MKNILIKGLSALCFATLTFTLAKFAFAQNSSAASTQLDGEEVSLNNIGLHSQPANEPVLAVAPVRKGTGRATVESEEGLVYADFAVKPFEVKKSNERHGWTMIDARRPEHVDQLSHNDEERERHLDENSWVRHRELVYRKETLLDSVQQAEANNEELKEVILPGIGGEEYRVEVLHVDDRINEEGVREGSISGRLADDPSSEVILGYYGQRESGGISSVDQNIYISYDPREDSQIIVKQVDDEALTFAYSESGCNTDHGSNEVGEPNAGL